MKLRYKLINNLDVNQNYKDAVIQSEKKLNYRSLIFIIAEIFQKFVKNIPDEILEFAAGYPFLIHQYACENIIGENDVMKAVEEKKNILFRDKPNLLLEINKISKDSKYWDINSKHLFLEDYFADENFEDISTSFKKMEDFYMKHRSYGLLTILIISEYADDELAIHLKNANISILNGMSYFYDVIPHDPTFKSSFSLLLTRHYLKAYDIELLDYKDNQDQVQKYLIATSVFEEMLKISSNHFQDAIDFGNLCVTDNNSGGRISLIQHQLDKCTKLIAQCESMFD